MHVFVLSDLRSLQTYAQLHSGRQLCRHAGAAAQLAFSLIHVRKQIKRAHVHGTEVSVPSFPRDAALMPTVCQWPILIRAADDGSCFFRGYPHRPRIIYFFDKRPWISLTVTVFTLKYLKRPAFILACASHPLMLPRLPCLFFACLA